MDGPAWQNFDIGTYMLLDLPSMMSLTGARAIGDSAIGDIEGLVEFATSAVTGACAGATMGEAVKDM